MKTKHVNHEFEQLCKYKKTKHESFFKAPSHHCIVLQTYDACNGTKITTYLLTEEFAISREKSRLVNKENR